MHEGTLYYMRARYYDSTTGRFISWDPLGENLLDVKSLNLYHYAAQNPLGFIDPMGLDGQSPRGTRSIFGREELREERFSLRSELWDLGDKLEHLEDASIAALGGFVGALNTTPTEYVGMSNFSSNPDYLPSLGAFVAGYDNETVSNWIKDDQLFFYNQAAAIGAQLPQLRAERQRVRERLESLEDLQRLLYPDDYQRDIPLEQFLNPNPFAGSLPQAVPNSSRQTQQSPKPCLFGGIRLSVPGIPDDPNYPGVDEIIN
jgi:RHS repeat-associated protein